MLARLCLGFLLIAAALWLGSDSQFPRDEYDFTVEAGRFTEHQQSDPWIIPRRDCQVLPYFR